MVATPLIAFCTIIYAQDAVNQPASRMFPIGLAIFGMTAALSGVSFSMARAYDNVASVDTAKYAGEKFLHSAILLVQGLLLLYIRDTAVENEWVKIGPHLVSAIKVVTNSLASLVTAGASWAWFHGYAELNKILWENWRRRIENINTVPKDTGPTVLPKADTDVTKGSSHESVAS